jgi:hypothetical protein
MVILLCPLIREKQESIDKVMVPHSNSFIDLDGDCLAGCVGFLIHVSIEFYLKFSSLLSTRFVCHLGGSGHWSSPNRGVAQQSPSI